jgi:hypothetical protein
MRFILLINSLKRFICVGIIFFSFVVSAQAQNNALDFDGANNYVSVPASTAFDVTQFSLECWLTSTNFSTSGQMGVIAHGPNGGANNYYQLYFNNNSLYLFINDTSNTNRWIGTLNSVLGISDNNTYHIAVTYEGNGGRARFYVNGILEYTSGVKNFDIRTSAGYGLIIGSYSDKYFNGKIDEVRLWNTARTQTEIQTNMNTELTTATGLVANYHFNQGTAGGNNSGVTSLTDSSGNSNNGTLTNFALTGATSNWVTSGATILSTNADLSALTTTAGTITPVFASETTSYTASVSNATTSITVSPTKADANAIIQVQVNGGGFTTIATTSDSLALEEGINTVDVNVAAQDGSTLKIYTITVTRGLVPTMSSFNDQAKRYFDASYTIVAPTSNSSGLLSYTSSNAAVATISGTTVTINGAGSTTITATQAGDATYNSGSITYVLTVTAVSVLSKSGEISTTNPNYVNKNGGIGTGIALSRNGAILAAKTPIPPIAIVGDIREGGVVFWVDGNGGGLVCALSDQPTFSIWGCQGTDLVNVSNVPYNGGNPVGPGAEIGDGEANTNNILNDCPSAPAALAARSLGPEWFLPSAKELNQMYIHKTTLEAVEGFAPFSSSYWSSTEYSNNSAWLQSFSSGNYGTYNKSSSKFVRAVRAF